MKRSPLNKQGKETKKWLAFRKEFLKSRENWHGVYNCEICMKATEYPELDHIKKRSTHPELKYEESNIQLLCKFCHRKETARKP